MFDLFVRSLPLLESAVTMTVFLGLASFALGSALGLAVALARVSSIRFLRGIAFAYVSIFRGTPLLV
ncbi:ABC transporter permease subunit, partial [Metabacillus halosaccharovorans]|nr:ABC transporter permease subunit [Metabacillus halosaccharovorans]